MSDVPGELWLRAELLLVMAITTCRGDRSRWMVSKKLNDYSQLPIANVALRQPTGDLILEFEQGTSLEILNSSSGLEAWQCATTGGLLAIAHGGGEIGVWTTDPSLASGEPVIVERS